MPKTLEGLHPRLKETVPKILKAMEDIGFPMLVTDTVRSVQEQQALFAKGRTDMSGPVVTYADGVKTRSNHQFQPDMLGHAVDMCFLVDGKPSWDVKMPWHVYGAIAEALGLSWGGSWKKLTDLPHIEVPYHA